MEDANLIVRVDIEPKRQKVSKGAKAGSMQRTILGSSLGQVALSKPQICQAIENLMSRPDREVLEARPHVPGPGCFIAHGSRQMNCPGHGSGRMGGHKCVVLLRYLGRSCCCWMLLISMIRLWYIVILIGVCSYSNFFLCRLFFAQVEVVDEWLAQTANHVTEETMMKWRRIIIVQTTVLSYLSWGPKVCTCCRCRWCLRVFWAERWMEHNGALLKNVIRKVTGTITSMRA